MTKEEETFIRIDEPTPNGGAYGIMYFYDENDKPCVRSKATKAVCVEYDEEDNVINTTYATL